jgi:ribosomal protein S18 acetylase RimI-like enzyme
MKLRVLTSADLPAVAAVHVAAFPRAAISHLGREAARRYYHALSTGPHATVGLGAFDEDRLTGFSFVGVRHIAEGHYVRSHPFFLAWCVATHPQLLMKPFIWSRIGSGLRLLLRRAPRPDAVAAVGQPGSGRSYGIQYLAVDPDSQGRGVGKFLLRASEELALREGCNEIHLSVYLDNPRGIGLYEKMGWGKRSEDGVWHGLMSKRLHALPAPQPHTPVSAA